MGFKANYYYVFQLAVGLATLGFLAQPCMADNTLVSGQSLQSGQSLTYAQYTFIMQADCNLVLYANGNNVLWASGTNGKGGILQCECSMQNDGNLVIYAGTDPVWASNTSGPVGSYRLVLQGDGNAVIYGGAIWSTNTVQTKKKL